MTHGGTVAKPYDKGACATLILDTGSGRLQGGRWRGSDGCRRTFVFGRRVVPVCIQHRNGRADYDHRRAVDLRGSRRAGEVAKRAAGDPAGTGDGLQAVLAMGASFSHRAQGGGAVRTVSRTGGRGCRRRWRRARPAGRASPWRPGRAGPSRARGAGRWPRSSAASWRVGPSPWARLPNQSRTRPGDSWTVRGRVPSATAAVYPVAALGKQGGHGPWPGSWRLLSGHGDPEALLGADEVVVVVDVQVDLDPAHPAAEAAVLGAVVVADRGAAVAADVGGLIGGEQHRHGPLDPALTSLGAIDIEGDVATLGQPAAVVG